MARPRIAVALVLALAQGAAAFHAVRAPLAVGGRLHRERVRRCLAVRAAAAAPAVLHGIEEVVDRYDAFLIDQWGVMHDGTTAYPKAVDCMAKLAERGKKIVLLSNSSRRKGKSMKKLDAMGFERCARTAGRTRSLQSGPRNACTPPLCHACCT
jgi:hypothetical protein